MRVSGGSILAICHRSHVGRCNERCNPCIVWSGLAGDGGAIACSTQYISVANTCEVVQGPPLCRAFGYCPHNRAIKGKSECEFIVCKTIVHVHDEIICIDPS